MTEIKNRKSSSKDESSSPLKSFVFIIVIVLIAALVWFFSGKKDGSSNQSLEITKGIVAIVNTDTITQVEFENELANAKRSLELQGIDFSVDKEAWDSLRKQTMLSLVNQRLVLQDAQRKNVTLTDEELNEQIQAIKDRFSDENEFTAELKKANLTLEKFQDNVRNDVIIEKYLDKETNRSSIVATENELKEAYETIKKEQGEEAPAFNEIENSLSEQIIDNKLSKEVQKIIDNLRMAGVVKISADLK